MGQILSALSSLWNAIFKREKRNPIKGCFPRIQNIIVNNFRGLVGVLVPVFALAWMMGKGKPAVQVMWMLMFWCFLLQPIAIPCTGMIPIFFIPMTGTDNTVNTCKCYFNENIALFILSPMLLLLLNNSGFDRRAILACLGSQNPKSYGPISLIFKSSIMAFILSMFSNRLIVTTIITQYLTPVLTSLRTTRSGAEPNYDELRYIVMNAVQTSSAIGSIGIMSAAYCTMAFRAIWTESAIEEHHMYPDIFNFLQYSAFAIPVAIVMFILNFIYHTILFKIRAKGTMSDASMLKIKTEIMKLKGAIPKKITSHEILTILVTIAYIAVHVMRWNTYGNWGWADYNKLPESTHFPTINDATVAALFLLIVHSFPRSLNFYKIFKAKKRSELKDLKPESAILFWRFVDRNTNYGYFFLIGGGLAIDLALRASKLNEDLTAHLGKKITDLDFNVGLLVVCIIICILANAMTGVAAVVIFLPFVLSMAGAAAADPWPKKVYLPALGVGIGGTLGFMCPFAYTPAYFCHHTGKVPMSKMAKYSLVSVIICCLVLWVALCFYAPVIFDGEDKGIAAKFVKTFGKQKVAAGGDAGAGTGGGEAAPGRLF